MIPTGKSFPKLATYSDGVTVAPETATYVGPVDPRTKLPPPPVEVKVVALTCVEAAGRVAVSHLTAEEALAVAEELAGQAFAIDPSLRGEKARDSGHGEPPAPPALPAAHDGDPAGAPHAGAE